MRIDQTTTPRLRPFLSALLPDFLGDRGVRGATGISRARWRDLGCEFPVLGSDPGPEAARARRKFQELLGRAFSSERLAPEFRPEPPPPDPCVYASAHIGDLRSLRYLLRAHIAVGTVVNQEGEHRAATGREHRDVEEWVPRDFPNVFRSSNPHALRSALRRGSLLVAADLPQSQGVAVACLGGQLRLDARPFRLARLAGVPCRSIFLTAPGGRLTITIGAELPSREEEALPAFGADLARVAKETPHEIDGVTWWNRLGRR